MTSQHSFEELIQQLNSDDQAIRFWAVAQLGDIGDERAIPYLFKELADSHRGRVAATSLTKYTEIVAETLIDLLSSASATVRRNAASALGHLKYALAKQALLDTFLKDEDADVRREAARALGCLGDRALVGTLVADFDKGSFEVQSGVMEALGTLGGEEVVDFLAKYIQRSYERGLGEVPTHIIEGAVVALTSINTPSVVKPILDAIRFFDEDYGISVYARDALIVIAERDIDALSQAVDDPNSVVREAVADALEHVPSIQSRAFLEKLASDPVEQVAKTAKFSLAHWERKK